MGRWSGQARLAFGASYFVLGAWLYGGHKTEIPVSWLGWGSNKVATISLIMWNNSDHDQWNYAPIIIIMPQPLLALGLTTPYAPNSLSFALWWTAHLPRSKSMLKHENFPPLLVVKVASCRSMDIGHRPSKFLLQPRFSRLPNYPYQWQLLAVLDTHTIKLISVFPVGVNHSKIDKPHYCILSLTIFTGFCWIDNDWTAWCLMLWNDINLII